MVVKNMESKFKTSINIQLLKKMRDREKEKEN